MLLCGHFVPVCYDGFAYIRFYLVLPSSRLSFLAQFYLLRNLLLIPCVWGAFVCFILLWPFFCGLAGVSTSCMTWHDPACLFYFKVFMSSKC